MRILRENKIKRVERSILRLVNNHCPEMRACMDGPRLNNRVNLMMVVMVVPIRDGKPQIEEAFTALSKEISNTGVAVVLDHACAFDEVMLGFQHEGEKTFFRAEAKHLNPMGGGFYQLGFQLLEVIAIGDYPELDGLSL